MTTSLCKVPISWKEIGPKILKIFGHRIALIAVVGLLGTAGPATSQSIEVPSGVPIRLFDVILEEETAVARFRFVSEAIDPAKEGRGFVDLVDDLLYLCERVVLPSLAANEWAAEEVVLSVASQETEFGVFTDGVTQFFQPYVVADGACEWTDF